MKSQEGMFIVREGYPLLGLQYTSPSAVQVFGTRGICYVACCPPFYSKLVSYIRSCWKSTGTKQRLEFFEISRMLVLVVRLRITNHRGPRKRRGDKVRLAVWVEYEEEFKIAVYSIFEL